MEIVATEAGRWNADVMGVCNLYSVEVEVKVSKADLLKEFEKKASKHALYRLAQEGKSTRSVPNYFYFYVPEKLKDEAIKIVSEKMPRAGVAVYIESLYGRDGDRTYVAKRPQKLHDGKPEAELRNRILMRMASELCGRHVAWREHLRNGESDTTEVLCKTISEAIGALPGTKDFDPELGEESK